MFFRRRLSVVHTTPRTMSKKVVVMGTGTSSGVPTVSCKCPVCTSKDPKDKRLRSSVLVESDTTRIVIDSSPDFRRQMLKYDVDKLDAVVFTHCHFDHIGGFDDIRAFNYTSGAPVPIYLMPITFEKIKRTFYYAFGELEQEGGGVPAVAPFFIEDKPFKIGDIDITPIPLLHGKMKVLGFRIDDFAYCTDVNQIPEESYSLLKNLDCLILDALRYTKHPTHFSLDEAIAESGKINAGKTYFTHIAHQIKHSECQARLPESFYLAYDGLVLKI